MRSALSAALLGISIIASGAGPTAERVQQHHPEEALIARAKAFELDTPYVPPPGDPLEHNTSGYAKTMCSAVFITGLNPEIAAENVGFFTGPVRATEEGREAEYRSCPQGNQHHDAERCHRRGSTVRVTGLHHLVKIRIIGRLDAAVPRG